MANVFSDEERNNITEKFINLGFELLKQGGIKAVNIDILVSKCFVSKGTFYNIFKDKSDFIYSIICKKRMQTKEKLNDYLSEDGQLSREGLFNYLKWMCDEDSNIFSYLNKQETRWLISKWPIEYLEDEDKDEKTASWIIAHIKKTKEVPNWQLFCNCLKLMAWTVNSKEFLIEEAYNQTINMLINNACDCVCN